MVDFIRKLSFENFSPENAYGFCDFRTIDELHTTRCSSVPLQKGTYCVYFPSYLVPDFQEYAEYKPRKRKNIQAASTGAEPLGVKVGRDILERKWVKNASVIYIGKAGGASFSSTLHSRIKAYVDFGFCKVRNHWGGRYIWHIKGVKSVCKIGYYVTPDQDEGPREQGVLKSPR